VSAPPYMKLYVADYVADTMSLTRDEHGAYLLLLMSLWRAGGKLPNNPAKLAQIAKCTPAEWEQIGPTMMDFFIIRGGRVTHKRATEELAKYDRVIQGSKAAGKASASKRANENNDLASTSVENPLNEISTNQNQNQKEKKGAKAPSSDGLFSKAWAAYPDGGRRRSAKGKAADVWAKIADEAGGEGALLSAVLAYARTPDATRDDGQYAPAFERWLRDGKWEHYRGDLFSGEIGEAETLPERVQRAWAEDWRDKGPGGWKRWERGPCPGEPGCRVSPAIIAEFTRQGVAA